MSKQSLIDDIQVVLGAYADVSPEQFVPSMRQMLVDFAGLDTNGKPRQETPKSEIELAGVRCLVAHGGRDQSSDAILYIHGGGFVAGSPETHLGLINHLAFLSKMDVIAVDYPLLPEVSGEQTLGALTDVYRQLVAHAQPETSFFIAGDSVGGLLSLALTQRLIAQHVKPPKAVATFSAVTDLAMSGASYDANAEKEIMLSKEMLGALYSMYLAGRDADDPEFAPLYGDNSGFPPLLMQVGGDEILKDDSVMMVDAVNTAGGQAQLEVWPDLFHVWHNFPSRIPEAAQALANAAKFFDRAR